MTQEKATGSREVTLRYFAWIRERVGVSEERLALPASLVTVADVVAWQRARGGRHAEAFCEPSAVRVAVDRAHARHDAPIGDALEIGFFPPVTGG